MFHSEGREGGGGGGYLPPLFVKRLEGSPFIHACKHTSILGPSGETQQWGWGGGGGRDMQRGDPAKPS